MNTALAVLVLALAFVSTAGAATKLNALKLLVQQAPWNSKTYRAIAEVYDTVGWQELVSIWRNGRRPDRERR